MSKEQPQQGVGGVVRFQCPRCVARGKTWDGDDPRCAFRADGLFDTQNWMCATMAELRWRAEERAVWGEGQNAANLPLDGKGVFLVLSWYKNRGRTDGAWALDDNVMTPLTLEEAEQCIAANKLEVKP